MEPLRINPWLLADIRMVLLRILLPETAPIPDRRTLHRLRQVCHAFKRECDALATERVEREAARLLICRRAEHTKKPKWKSHLAEYNRMRSAKQARIDASAWLGLLAPLRALLPADGRVPEAQYHALREMAERFGYSRLKNELWPLTAEKIRVDLMDAAARLLERVPASHPMSEVEERMRRVARKRKTPWSKPRSRRWTRPPRA
jgi:hypothetical protein